MPRVKAYVELTGPKTGGIERDLMRPCWYRIAMEVNLLGGVKWVGPYRDRTDAENAARVEAERQGLKLEWV